MLTAEIKNLLCARSLPCTITIRKNYKTNNLITQKKYAAIDIGSNAVRLLISTITEQEGRDPIFKKTSLVRVPIRLGADVFQEKRISEENIVRMIDTIQAFKLLMKSHRIERFKACATSAMRESANGQEVAQLIKEKTGVVIKIIDGSDEAAIIAATDLHALIQTDKTYLYVDVGGGSTEFTLYSEGKNITSRSFKLGTVRLLNELVPEGTWEEVETPDGTVYGNEKFGGYIVKDPKGIWGALGYDRVLYRKYRMFAEFRYERGEGFIGTPIQSFSTLNNYNLLLGIRF